MLDLTMMVPPGKESEAVRELYARLTPENWAQLVHLAALVVSLQEQVATGQVVLVAVTPREHLQAAVRECTAGAMVPELRGRR